MAYQRAIDIFTGAGETEGKATDPPENVREVVAELHYRIGLSLVPNLFLATASSEGDDYGQEQCSLHISSKPTTRSCLELAAYQFSTTLQFHPMHEGASSSLTIVTGKQLCLTSYSYPRRFSLFNRCL